MQVSWKGKGKVTDQDFEDLNPTITYRHLHSQNLGIRDPLRVIALCDSDAFYAACEMVRLGVDKDTPLVVLQWDALIAINYPARKFGITRLKKYNMKELQAKHPELKIVHVATYKEGVKQPGYWDDVDTKTHKVSLDYYRRESLKIAAKFKECLPRVEIEKASIDEAFFDFSKRVREVLLERYPYLAQVPPDAPDGADTPLPSPPCFSWSDIKHSILIPIHPAPPIGDKEDDTTSILVAYEEALPTWHDIALSIGAELMEAARRQVYEQLGYSTSAGIARNKFLAKLTASYKKPKNQTILRNAAIPEYLCPLPFQKIRFLGGKLGTAIASEFAAATVQDLLSIGLEEMQRKFGEESIWIYEVLRGIDRSEVKEKKTTLNKSMLASKNLPQPITNASEGFHWIRVLAAELALRLNEAREISPNLWPKSIVLRARRGYTNSGQSKQAAFPFTPEVTVDTVAAAGNTLWKDLVGTDFAMKVTNVSLAFTGLESAEFGQRSIEGFLKSPKRQRDERGDDGSDRISFDENLVYKSDDILGDDVLAEDQRFSKPFTFSFDCSRCGRSILISSPVTPFLDEDKQLAALRLEHDDFHFAQDLAKEPMAGPILLRPSTGGAKCVLKPPSRGSPHKKKIRKQESRGIERFFRQS